MKKLFSILAIAFFAITLTSCGPSSQSKSEVSISHCDALIVKLQS
jgi:hypothetical protein